MIAQAYFDDDPYVRIFDGSHSDQWLCDISLLSSDERSADIALQDMHLRKTTKWERCSKGMLEAKVRFK